MFDCEANQFPGIADGILLVAGGCVEVIDGSSLLLRSFLAFMFFRRSRSWSSVLGLVPFPLDLAAL